MRPPKVDGWRNRVRSLMMDGKWHSATEIRNAASRHGHVVERLALLISMHAEFRTVPTAGRPIEQWRADASSTADGAIILGLRQ